MNTIQNNNSSLFFKRTVIVFFLIHAFCFVQSQSFNIGLTGGGGGAVFINPSIWQAGTEQKYRYTPSYNYGIQSALNLGNGASFELDILDCNITQGYSGSFSTSGAFPGSGVSYFQGGSYTSETKLNVIQVPFTVRYKRNFTGIYVEAGVGDEIILSAAYSATYTNPTYNINSDVTSSYPKSGFLAIAGLGWDKQLFGDYNFYLNTGIRIDYGLLDIEGVDGHGQAFEIGGAANPYYTNEHTTHSLDVFIHLGIFYKFLFPDNGRGHASENGERGA